MYLSQTNGPGYARVVGSLGCTVYPFNRSPWDQSYNTDYTFAGDFPMGYSPVLVSDPMLVSDILGIPNIYGQHSAEANLFAFERPQHDDWSSDIDFGRYGSFLDVVNQIQHLRQNLDTPRENGVSHRHYSGTVRDLDIPLFDRHTATERGIWLALQHVYDVLDPFSVMYREIQSTGFNTDGYLEFIARGPSMDAPGSNSQPTLDYWEHTRRIVERVSQDGFFSVLVDYGEWPSSTSWPDGYHLLVIKDLKDESKKGSNWWHFDTTYVYEKKYQERGGQDLWVTSYDVHIDFWARFLPARGSRNPFDWNIIPDEVFQIVDHSTVSVRSSEVDYFGYHYSRWPVDEVTPPVTLFVPPLDFRSSSHPKLFSTISQSSVGERSRLWRLLSFDTPQRDPSAYAKRISKNLDSFWPDIRATSFYSSSEALHSNIDVLKSNNIENATQLSGILDLLPDLSAAGSIFAKVAKRDPSAILDSIDFLANAVLAFRFGQKPTTDDAMEIARTDIKKELKDLLQSSTSTIYGSFHYSFTLDDMTVLRLPGTMKLETRSKIRIHTDITSLLAGYLTANGMGMMPTLSRLWAVVPFSFVVDWFTGMSSKLQSVDDQLLWMALDTNWCLHSYKLSYYPPLSDLDKYSLVTDPDDPFCLTIYKREFSRLMPRLTSAQFDYQAPKHGPDPVTVGALVWQFL